MIIRLDKFNSNHKKQYNNVPNKSGNSQNLPKSSKKVKKKKYYFTDTIFTIRIISVMKHAARIAKVKRSSFSQTRN